MHTVYYLNSDNFVVHPKTTKRNGYRSDQRSFHQLLKVVSKNGLQWRAIGRKEHLGGATGLKKLFEQRKMRSTSRLYYRTDCHLISNSRTLRREKRQLWQLRNLRSHGRVWSSVGFLLFFGKQSILADHPPRS